MSGIGARRARFSTRIVPTGAAGRACEVVEHRMSPFWTGRSTATIDYDDCNTMAGTGQESGDVPPESARSSSRVDDNVQFGTRRWRNARVEYGNIVGRPANPHWRVSRPAGQGGAAIDRRGFRPAFTACRRFGRSIRRRGARGHGDATRRPVGGAQPPGSAHVRHHEHRLRGAPAFVRGVLSGHDPLRSRHFRRW